MKKAILKLILLVFTLFCLATPLQAAEPAAPTHPDWATVNEVLDLIDKYPVNQPGRAGNTENEIKNLLEAMDDPYSYYMDPSEYEAVYNGYSNNYIGIGVVFQMDERYPLVTEVFKDSPADRAGIKPDDMLIKVNGRSVADLTSLEILARMDGRAGSKIGLTIRRSGSEDFDLTLTQELIHAPAVYDKILDGQIGYIRLSQFSAGSAYEFRNAAFAMKRQGVSKLIVDMRGNPGGLLGEAMSIANLFLKIGTPIVNIEDSDGNREVLRTSGMPILLGTPTVILVDNLSASASELLSGALQDHQVAVIVGERTYGKGSMQEMIPLASGAAVSVTVAKYYTPLGHQVDGIGISPDYQVIAPEMQLVTAQKLLLPPGEDVAVFEKDSVQVMVNDIPVQIGDSIIEENGKVYLPLRVTFEALGYKVDWPSKDAARNTVGVRISGFGRDVFISSIKAQNRNGLELHFVEETLYVSLEDLNLFGVSYEIDGKTIEVKKKTN